LLLATAHLDSTGADSPVAPRRGSTAGALRGVSAEEGSPVAAIASVEADTPSPAEAADSTAAVAVASTAVAALMAVAAAVITDNGHGWALRFCWRVLSAIRSSCGAGCQIGSSGGDCAPPPSHTTGHAVFRIRRLNQPLSLRQASMERGSPLVLGRRCSAPGVIPAGRPLSTRRDDSSPHLELCR